MKPGWVVMVSTIASGESSSYIGATHITMLPSIVNVSGLNRISQTIFTNAAGAFRGMVAEDIE